MSFGKNILRFIEYLAEAQTSANASRITGSWRAPVSGAVCHVAVKDDNIALGLWRADGSPLCICLGKLIVNTALLQVMDETGRPNQEPNGLLTIIGGGASIELHFYEPGFRFRDAFVR